MSAKETEHNQPNLDSRLKDLEMFYLGNKKAINTGLLSVAAIIVLYVGYIYFYVKPQNQEVERIMHYAEAYYMQDSFNLALNGDGGDNPGLLYIADNFGATHKGSLAGYLAGTCLLRTGEYETAIDYFNKYSGDDFMIAVQAIGGIGDANAELGNYDEAASYYMKAANHNNNELLSPYYLMKAGQAYEELGDKDKALAAYKKIKAQYKDSRQGNAIEKDIYRLETELGNS